MRFQAVLACALVLAACGHGAGARSPDEGTPPIPVLGAIPPGTLTVEEASTVGPGAPVRVAAVLVAPMPECPPCPPGASCSVCLTYATYKSLTGDAKLAVQPGGGSRLTAGAVYVLEGTFDASEGFSKLRYERISRVVDIPDPSGTSFGLPPPRVLETHGVPPGVLRLEDAEGYGDGQMLRMLVTFRAPVPACAPCPPGAACSPCPAPYAAFSGADGQHAFQALVGPDLDKEPVGGEYVLEGSWGGDGSGRRLFNVVSVARVLR
jgi:hypothetical protein